MTPSQLRLLDFLAHDEWTISNDCMEAVKAALAERQAVINCCKSRAHPGCNAGSHADALEVLKLMGEHNQPKE